MTKKKPPNKRAPTSHGEVSQASEPINAASFDGDVVGDDLTEAEVRRAVKQAIGDGALAAPGAVVVTFDYATGELKIDNATGQALDIRGVVLNAPPPIPPPEPPEPLTDKVSALDELRGAAGALYSLQNEIPAAELEQLPTPERHLALAMFAALTTYHRLLLQETP